LLARFRGDETHARHVADLSLALFDGLKHDHELGDETRRLLEYAGLLHDVGSVIAHDRHTEHSQYIISHGGLRGLSAEEIAVVATVARYHGKARPRKSDRAYAALSRPDRRAARWLAALLRIAEALDRSQYQLVRSVRVQRTKGTVTLRVRAADSARLELWAARGRTGLLSRLLGRRVRIVPESTPFKPAARAKTAPSRATRKPAPRASARARPGARARPRRSQRPRGGKPKASAPKRRGRTPRRGGAGGRAGG
jgi:exopolyphosphatase/guanosine-5'-triphosphate,3'-diphosphate pyrophosphatase